MVDYYEVLGVARSATAEDIKRSYRKLARQLHPDVNGGDKDAENRFKLVTEAYDTLSDPEKRRQYDLYGSSGGAGSDPFGGGPFQPNFTDIFQTVFGQGFGGQEAPGPRRGEDMETAVNLAFEEAVFGCQKEISLKMPTTCPTCSGSGAKVGTSPTVCAQCQGSGSVKRVTQSFLGRMVTTMTCDVCHGEGKVITDLCPDCRGEGRKTLERHFTIEVPPGADNGLVLRLTGKGAAAPRGGQPGSLYVHVNVAPSQRFERQGNDLWMQLPLSYVQAALGAQVDFESLDGPETIEVAPGTQPGATVHLKGKGVPVLSGRGRGRGDLIVAMDVQMPKELSEEEEGLLRQLAELRGEQVLGHHEHGIFSKLKSAFKP
ncbi:molecular chaperone DnaJ [Ferrimicrobium sp.]|uniref:molecular chaperone DnaJ n=1 Tax=Ferrimicrobium sp. TaxID=2926050 RepID=UPI002637D87A|nr:molecular chaperone DnaJ [Ferrimicrobium sp.]